MKYSVDVERGSPHVEGAGKAALATGERTARWENCRGPGAGA
jgi:hypothetical protein